MLGEIVVGISLAIDADDRPLAVVPLRTFHDALVQQDATALIADLGDKVAPLGSGAARKRLFRVCILLPGNHAVRRYRGAGQALNFFHAYLEEPRMNLISEPVSAPIAEI